jgi:hypothetical protein
VSGHAGTPVSMVLTALATVCVSHGVPTGRTGRTVVALAVMGLYAVAASWRFLAGAGDQGRDGMHVVVGLEDRRLPDVPERGR